MRSDAPRDWVHHPHHGQLAWGAAVLTAPCGPLLFTLTFLLALSTDLHAAVESRISLAPVPWLAVGGVLLCVASRIPRGIGLGLLGGSAASLVLALAAVHGG